MSVVELEERVFDRPRSGVDQSQSQRGRLPDRKLPAGAVRSPVTMPRQAAMPGRRPVNPSAPARLSLPLTLGAPAVIAESSAGWRLTDRGLAVIMIAFALLMVTGLIVTMATFVSVSAPEAAPVASEVSKSLLVRLFG